MSTIETMLQSEFVKVCRVISRLEDECSQRPKGSLVLKPRGNKKYFYLIRREAGRVITTYVGREGSWKAKGLEAKIIERRRYESELAEAISERDKLKKMMKASGIFFVEPER